MTRQKKINIVLGGIIALLGIVLILDSTSNRRMLRELQREKTIERKKSEKIVDSLNKIIKLDSVSLNKRVDSILKERDKLQKDYEKLLKEQDKIKADIRSYLTSTDSIRFSKFRQLITEVD